MLMIPITVDPAHDGFRVDRFLSRHIRRLSRTRIQAIIAAGHLRREHASAPLTKPSARVRRGERLILSRPVVPEPPVVLDYRVLFRDPDLLILDKPAGLPVHPTARYHQHTLTALMRERMGPDHGWQMAHRLDRETSGVLALARSGASAIQLKRAFAQRRTEKQYLALVEGRLEQSQRIAIPLGPAPGSRIRIKIGPRPVAEGGLEAITEVVPVRFGTFRGQAITLIVARPWTGRQHQIRVHLACVGHPVLGDKLYGLDEQWFLDVVENRRSFAELEAWLGLHRHALHAAELLLPHPRSRTQLRFTAPWPPELAQILEAPATLPRWPR
jgi:23S rRNA pseudouridine1911/1915/1917 synthase